MDMVEKLAGKVMGGHHQGGHVTVQVVEARNLARKDLLSKSDPYCEVSVVSKHSISMLSSKQKTSVINNNQNPMWNQSFSLSVSNPETEMLKIKCWDNDPMSFDDLIGEVDVPLFQLYNGVPKDEWYQLYPPKGGSVHLIITAQGFGMQGGPQMGMGQGMGMGMGMQGGYQQGGYQQGGGYPMQQRPMGYSPQQGGGYVPQAGGYPPMPSQGYPMQGGGYPPQGYNQGYPMQPPMQQQTPPGYGPMGYQY